MANALEIIKILANLVFGQTATQSPKRIDPTRVLPLEVRLLLKVKPRERSWTQ
jgi:hypothetical protein